MHKSGGMCTSLGACAQVWGHVYTSGYMYMCTSWGGMCTSQGECAQVGGMCTSRGWGACAQVRGACTQLGGHVHKSRGMCTSRGHVYRSGACAQVGGMCTTRGTCAEVNKMGPTLIERIHVCLFQWEVHKLQYKSSIPVLIT